MRPRSARWWGEMAVLATSTVAASPFLAVGGFTVAAELHNALPGTALPFTGFVGVLEALAAGGLVGLSALWWLAFRDPDRMYRWEAVVLTAALVVGVSAAVVVLYFMIRGAGDPVRLLLDPPTPPDPLLTYATLVATVPPLFLAARQLPRLVGGGLPDRSARGREPTG